jgi:hypothetical protein
MKRFDVLLTPADASHKSYKQTVVAADDQSAIAATKNYLLSRLAIFEKVSKEEALARIETYSAEVTEKTDPQIEETSQDLPTWLDKKSMKD